MTTCKTTTWSEKSTDNCWIETFICSADGVVSAALSSKKHACLFQPLPYRSTKLICIKNEFAQGKHRQQGAKSPGYSVTLMIKNSPKLTASRAVTQKAEAGGSQHHVGLGLSPLQPPTPWVWLPRGTQPFPWDCSPPASPPSWGLT